MSFTRTLGRFIFGVMGLPLTIAQKTLYSHRSHGLGLGYFPVLHPTRAVDVLHRNNHLSTLSTTPRLSMSPYNFFMSSVSKFKTLCSMVVPLDVSWKGAEIAKNATSVVSFAGLTVYLLPSSHKPNDTYSDGSQIGSPPAAGAAALLSTGEIAVCRVPGIPNPYGGRASWHPAWLPPLCSRKKNETGLARGHRLSDGDQTACQTSDVSATSSAVHPGRTTDLRVGGRTRMT